MAAKDELGRRGEDTAAEYLERAHGMVVLSRNWRCTHGEIDIVAVDPERRLVFCEVKTRSGLRYGEPAEAVTPARHADPDAGEGVHGRHGSAGSRSGSTSWRS
ncbi:YraN family protein [Pseudonocardia sp. ICBG601]|uniref:YraN family protein n=1 Tax=Pseudonocardia sp. ICBG601 TaxID=2846759 RepID=UPI001CF67F4A|nr:YraN family protein [Pseudonocardia sp. ICBG601]